MQFALTETSRPATAKAPLAASRTPRRRSLVEFVRYFAASVLALAVDGGLYALLLRVGAGYRIAAAVGFLAGVVVAYVISVRWVFSSRTMRSAVVEFGLFAAVGVLGLALTELLLWVQIEHWGLGPLLAKAGAAGCVFLFNFGVRKALLFRAATRMREASGVANG